ncbi:MAG: universal stress protein [Planctomycetota bacterium]|nr:universal stress protein [Planctomycetota bacterium]MDA1252501.1 universal stress protein [Planctomycetota bacterium]
MIKLNKILVPTDFSEHSAAAVRYGAELASKFHAELHLLHCVEQTPILYGEGGAWFNPDAIVAMQAAADKHLQELPVDAVGVKVVRKCVDGHPFVEVIRYAKTAETDLIVMGTHGRGAIAHLLLGSVAEKVVRKAPCPVLTVRDQEHEFVMP